MSAPRVQRVFTTATTNAPDYPGGFFTIVPNGRGQNGHQDYAAFADFATHGDSTAVGTIRKHYGKANSWASIIDGESHETTHRTRAAALNALAQHYIDNLRTKKAPTPAVIEPDTIVDAYDYHRNGVSGEGFDVAIVRHREDGQWHRFLVEFVSTRHEDHGFIDGVAYHDGEVAFVLDLDKAAKGNIYMHRQPGKPETGGNAWRGDQLLGKFLPHIARFAQQQHVERDEEYAREARERADERRAAGDEDGAKRSESFANTLDAIANNERDVLALIDIHYAK